MTKNDYATKNRNERKTLSTLCAERRALRRSSHGRGLRIERIARLASLQASIATEITPKLESIKSADSYAVTGGKNALEYQGAIERDSIAKYCYVYTQGDAKASELAGDNEPFHSVTTRAMVEVSNLDAK